MTKLILSITRGVIHDTGTRRGAMFRLLLAALLMLFVGATLIEDFLSTHLLAFILFWAACAWLTVAAVLLAAFDILVVSAAGRAARRQLEQDILKAAQRGKKDDTDDPTKRADRGN